MQYLFIIAQITWLIAYYEYSVQCFWYHGWYQKAVSAQGFNKQTL